MKRWYEFWKKKYDIKPIHRKIGYHSLKHYYFNGYFVEHSEKKSFVFDSITGRFKIREIQKSDYEI